MDYTLVRYRDITINGQKLKQIFSTVLEHANATDFHSVNGNFLQQMNYTITAIQAKGNKITDIGNVYSSNVNIVNSEYIEGQNGRYDATVILYDATNKRKNVRLTVEDISLSSVSGLYNAITNKIQFLSTVGLYVSFDSWIITNIIATTHRGYIVPIANISPYLSSITINGATINETFSSEKLVYTGSIFDNTTYVQFTKISNLTDVEVIVNGNVIELDGNNKTVNFPIVDENTVIEIYSHGIIDGELKTVAYVYTLTYNVEFVDNTLTNVTFDNISGFEPAFVSDHYSYMAYANTSSNVVTITPTDENSNISILLNDNVVNFNSGTAQFTFGENGNYKLDIIVDGTNRGEVTRKTYTFIINYQQELTVDVSAELTSISFSNGMTVSLIGGIYAYAVSTDIPITYATIVRNSNKAGIDVKYNNVPLIVNSDTSGLITEQFNIVNQKALVIKVYGVHNGAEVSNTYTITTTVSGTTSETIEDTVETLLFQNVTEFVPPFDNDEFIYEGRSLSFVDKIKIVPTNEMASVSVTVNNDPITITTERVPTPNAGYITQFTTDTFRYLSSNSLPSTDGYNIIDITIKGYDSGAQTTRNFRFKIKFAELPPYTVMPNLRSVTFTSMNYYPTFNNQTLEYTGTSVMPNNTIKIVPEETVVDIVVKLNGNTIAYNKIAQEAIAVFSRGINALTIEAIGVYNREPISRTFTFTVTQV